MFHPDSSLAALLAMLAPPMHAAHTSLTPRSFTPGIRRLRVFFWMIPMGPSGYPGVSSNVAGKSMKILHILRVWMRKSFCHLAIFDDTRGYIDDIWWPDEPMSECSIDIWEIADFEMMFSDFPLLSVNLPEESMRIHTHIYTYITVSISWPWLVNRCQ